MLIQDRNPNTRPTSRYRFTPLLRYSGRVIAGLPEIPAIDVSTAAEIEVYSVEENRLDRVSYRVYGDEQYWWVLAQANGISDPLELAVGTVLKVPSLYSLMGVGGILE